MDTIKDTLKSWITPAILVGILALAIGPVYILLGEVSGKIDKFHTDLKGDIRDLKGDIRELSGRLDSTRTELKGEINAVRTELKGEINAVRTELKGEINAVRTELKEDIRSLGARLDSTRDGLDRRMQATTARVDALNIRVDAVEGAAAPEGNQGNPSPDSGASPQ